MKKKSAANNSRSLEKVIKLNLKLKIFIIYVDLGIPG